MIASAIDGIAAGSHDAANVSRPKDLGSPKPMNSLNPPNFLGSIGQRFLGQLELPSKDFWVDALWRRPIEEVVVPHPDAGLELVCEFSFVQEHKSAPFRQRLVRW